MLQASLDVGDTVSEKEDEQRQHKYDSAESTFAVLLSQKRWPQIFGGLLDYLDCGKYDALPRPGNLEPVIQKLQSKIKDLNGQDVEKFLQSWEQASDKMFALWPGSLSQDLPSYRALSEELLIKVKKRENR